MYATQRLTTQNLRVPHTTGIQKFDRVTHATKIQNFEACNHIVNQDLKNDEAKTCAHG